MTQQHFEISALDLAVAESVVLKQHFYTFPEGGRGTRCLICSTAWETAEEWAAATTQCPGYVQPCGLDPVPGAEHRLRVGP